MHAAILTPPSGARAQDGITLRADATTKGGSFESEWANTLGESRLRGSVLDDAQGDAGLAAFGPPALSCRVWGCGSARHGRRFRGWPVDGGLRLSSTRGTRVESPAFTRPRLHDNDSSIPCSAVPPRTLIALGMRNESFRPAPLV